MEKLIVEVSVPATGEQYDFSIPAESPVCDTAIEMAHILCEANGNIIFNMEQVLLCDLDRHIILQEEMTLLEAGICDGSRLMLV